MSPPQLTFVVENPAEPRKVRKRARAHQANTNTSKPRPTKRQKGNNESEIVFEPFEATASVTPSQFIFSINGDDLTEAAFQDKAYAYYSLVAVEDQMIHVIDAPDHTKEASAETDSNIDILDVFNSLFEPFYLQLEREMNGMREERRTARQQPCTTRGRHPKQASHYNHMKYISSFSKSFSRMDIERFLACFFRICTLNAHDIAEYWQAPSSKDCGHEPWFALRMSRRLYEEMFQCLDPDIDAWIEKMNEQFCVNKDPSHYVCIDETMAPYRVRHNPHFMFIPRKPHPYGIKFEMLADDDTYFLCIRLHKRTEKELDKPAMLKGKRVRIERDELGIKDPSTVPEIVLDLCSSLAPNHHVVVGDKWFGNLDVSTELKKAGIDSILKCMGNRPTHLWDDMHKLPLNKYGVRHAVAQNDLNKNIYCFSKLNTDTDGNNESYENILSTVEFNNYVQRTILSANSEGERVEQNTILHEVFDVYNHVSSFVDEANRSLLSCFYGHRSYHYQTTLVSFFLCMIAHNARILYNKKSGKSLSQVEFLKALSNRIYPLEKQAVQHELRELHGEILRNCAVCYWRKKDQYEDKTKVPRSMTAFGCVKCLKPMCKVCFHHFAHSEYAAAKSCF